MVLDYSLGTAKKAANAVGATPPPNYPGGYDAWALEWFKQGVNSGDARLLKFADPHATVAEGGSEKDLVTNWQDAPDPSAWMGQRKPSPQELRKWANSTGRSEDYARFPDRVLSDWIKNYWDVGAGAFHNDFGDLVDKPSESGPNARAAGYTVGLKGGGGGPGGGGPGGGGGPAGPAQPTPGAAAYQSLEDPLQAALYQLAQSRGIQGQGGITGAQSLAGGGVLSWGQPPPPGGAPATPAATPAPAPAPAPAAAKPNTFAPTGGPAGSPMPALGGATNAWGAWAGPNTAIPAKTTWQGVGTPSPAAGTFDASLLDKFRGRNPTGQWWMK